MKKGFTLVEAMIALLITGIISGAVLTVFVMVAKMTNTAFTESEGSVAEHSRNEREKYGIGRTLSSMEITAFFEGAVDNLAVNYGVLTNLTGCLQ